MSKRCPCLTHKVTQVEKSGLVTGSVVGWPAEPPSLSRKAFPGRNPQEFSSVTCHCLSEVDPLLTSDWMSVKCSPNTGNWQPNYVNMAGGSVPSVLSVEAPGNSGEVLFQVRTPVTRGERPTPTTVALEQRPGPWGTAQPRLLPESSRSILAPQKASLEAWSSGH